MCLSLNLERLQHVCSHTGSTSTLKHFLALLCLHSITCIWALKISSTSSKHKLLTPYNNRETLTRFSPQKWLFLLTSQNMVILMYDFV